MRRILLILMCLPMLAVADDKKYEVDGIWYKLIYNDDILAYTAEVTFDDEKYSGEIHIPAEINVPELDQPTVRVTRIGEMAFKDCNLTLFDYHPESIEYVGREAFKNCVFKNSVEEMYFSFADDHQIRIGESAFENSGIEYVIFNESYPIIGENAFRNCKKLRNVGIPKYCLSLGAGAFYGCSELEVVNMKTYDYRFEFDPNGKTYLRTIGAEAFAYCPKAVIEIPEGIEVIGTGAFCGNGWTNVRLPRSLKTIESNAFEGNPVKDIYCYGFEIEPPVISPDAFDNPESITVHVSLLSSSVEAYEDAESWKIFKEFVGIDDLPVFTSVKDLSGADYRRSNSPDRPIYDLQGRRLNAMPQKGVYIQNGKKKLAK